MDDRRTEIVEEVESLPVCADLFHVYLDVEQGTWGDRKNLAVLTLTMPEVEVLRGMTAEQIKRQGEHLTRYFGNVADATGKPARKHLAGTDLA